MNNPYFIGLTFFNEFIGQSFKFQNDLMKIGVSTINANPLTTWTKLVIEDVILETTSMFTSLNRMPSIK